MKSTKVASRYAKSLLELAIEQNKIDAVLGDMNFLLQTSNETRDFELLIASPIVKADMKISVYILKKLLERLRKLLTLQYQTLVRWAGFLKTIQNELMNTSYTKER